MRSIRWRTSAESVRPGRRRTARPSGARGGWSARNSASSGRDRPGPRPSRTPRRGAARRSGGRRPFGGVGLAGMGERFEVDADGPALGPRQDLLGDGAAPRPPALARSARTSSASKARSAAESRVAAGGDQPRNGPAGRLAGRDHDLRGRQVVREGDDCIDRRRVRQLLRIVEHDAMGPQRRRAAPTRRCAGPCRHAVGSRSVTSPGPISDTRSTAWASSPSSAAGSLSRSPTRCQPAASARTHSASRSVLPKPAGATSASNGRAASASSRPSSRGRFRWRGSRRLRSGVGSDTGGMPVGCRRPSRDTALPGVSSTRSLGDPRGSRSWPQGVPEIDPLEARSAPNFQFPSGTSLALRTRIPPPAIRRLGSCAHHPDGTGDGDSPDSIGPIQQRDRQGQFRFVRNCFTAAANWSACGFTAASALGTGSYPWASNAALSPFHAVETRSASARDTTCRLTCSRRYVPRTASTAAM